MRSKDRGKNRKKCNRTIGGKIEKNAFEELDKKKEEEEYNRRIGGKMKRKMRSKDWKKRGECFEVDRDDSIAVNYD